MYNFRMESFDQVLIPSFPQLAFPIPLLLSKILLVVGFFLHAIPMNIVIGGTFLAAFFIWHGSKYSAKAGRALIVSLPVILSFAITQGIVPLLFLQLVYGPLFYSSSIYMAVSWISVIAVLIIAYYSIYVAKFNEEKLQGWGKNLVLFSGFLILVIAFIFSNNMTLMINPDSWSSFGENIATRGFNLNLADPQLVPRYLHFIIAGFAVTGLYLGCLGLFEKKDKKYSQWLIQVGSQIFVVTTLVQFLVGTWFLLSLQEPVMKIFMGQNLIATVSFGLSLILIIISIVAGIIAWTKFSKFAMLVCTTAGLSTVFAMIVMRHFLRDFSVSKVFHPELIPVSIQWDIFAAFLILAIGLIVYLVWLVRLTWGAFNK
jgi:hypothetical protein